MIKVKTVTVVGANGTMGTNVSAIFASFGNATVYMVSRDKEKSKKAAVKAGKSVKADSIQSHLIAADYSMLYQTPITWTKKSKWLSYSRIINWG